MGSAPVHYGPNAYPPTVPAADFHRALADATALAARNAELVAMVIDRDRTIAAQRSAVTKSRAAVEALHRVAAVSVVEQVFLRAIADLTCKEIEASRDGVIRLDDMAAAYARGQSAGIGERIRALSVGWNIHRHKPGKLSQWCVDETAGWTARACEPATVTEGSVARRMHDGWIDEARAHLQFLEALAAALATNPSEAVAREPRRR